MNNCQRNKRISPSEVASKVTQSDSESAAEFSDSDSDDQGGLPTEVLEVIEKSEPAESPQPTPQPTLQPTPEQPPQPTPEPPPLPTPPQPRQMPLPQFPHENDLRNKLRFSANFVSDTSIFNYQVRETEKDLGTNLSNKISQIPILTQFIKDKIEDFKMQYTRGEVSFKIRYFFLNIYIILEKQICY